LALRSQREPYALVDRQIEKSRPGPVSTFERHAIVTVIGTVACAARSPISPGSLTGPIS